MKFNKDLEPLVDLWIKVIKRSIDDLVLFIDNKTEIEQELFDSAHSFIFDDDHTIFLDNYWVLYHCQKCNNFIHELMSSFSMSYKCSSCSSQVKGEDVYISDLMMYLNKECPAVDLFEMLGIEDIEGMRKRVRALVKAKTGKEI